ncbi:hypothetical protein [Parafrankia discariae]|uniref:hypothetical protein n=1 Tax=Parafrankia discariae TaxID=365528 RepID=UPI00037E8C67|nr:hypothetical protein [Parafrankia discariae]
MSLALPVTLLALPFSVLAGMLLVLVGPAVLCAVAAAACVNRDGVASGALLALTAPFFVILTMILVTAAGWWSTAAGVGCVGAAFPLIWPLFWERRRERAPVRSGVSGQPRR